MKPWSFKKHSRHKARLSKYRLSEGRFSELVNKHNGLCHCCRNKKAKAIDHDHETGKVRGMLCYSCNMGLGLLGDNVTGLLRGLRYLGFRVTKELASYIQAFPA